MHIRTLSLVTYVAKEYCTNCQKLCQMTKEDKQFIIYCESKTKQCE
jgi:hypothetical protein